MTTYDLIPVPPELAEEVARRRAWGADTHDEVWDGEYRMAPGPTGPHGFLDAEMAAILRPFARQAGLRMTTAFNIGVPRDFRVTDAGLHRGPLVTWFPTAALVVEVVSPGDDSWEKLPFYAAREVDEVLFVDPDERSVVWMAREGDHYEPVVRSALLDVGVDDVAEQIDWP